MDADTLKLRLADWNEEAQALIRAGTETKLTKLEAARRDQTRRRDRLEQIGKDKQDILKQCACRPEYLDPDAISCRIGAASDKQKKAQKMREAARQEEQRLSGLCDAYVRERAAWKEAELAEAAHKKLADMVGAKGLKRELLWEAEKGILAHANAILESLSGGQLWMRLKSEVESEAAGIKPKAKRDSRGRRTCLT